MAHSSQNGLTQGAVPETTADAVLKQSAQVSAEARVIQGFDFEDYEDRALTVEELVGKMAVMGFQSTAISEAVRIINDMRNWRDPESRAGTTIFLGYTSNLVSSGLREIIKYLVKKKHISAIVTTAGGIEEDLIKCLAPTYLDSFTSRGPELREKGMNRIGNLVVPNNNYCAFEDWVMPIINQMAHEQEESKGSDKPLVWCPSMVVRRLGKEINNEASICYWAYKNDIPIFCPAMTDGSFGDMLFFHGMRTDDTPDPTLITDINKDVKNINMLAMNAKRAGMIILGGGVVKHHIANACLMRNGAESAVYINTAQEFDGSDAGARPDEAVSWGKIKTDADSVKVYAEATTVFPMIVASTFASKIS
ncbi:MAG: hypothetical protein Q9218_004126 [Villophora microphyllina]